MSKVRGRTVIPIKNTSISELNNPSYVSPSHIHENGEKGHAQLWSFICVITVFISSLFCCITM